MKRYVLIVLVMLGAVSGPAFGDVLVDYQADTLPPSPWVRVSNGPVAETSQHTTFVSGGVLSLIDDALLLGNTLGYYQLLAFDPEQTIDVEFRARVLMGETVLDDDQAPFSVWLHNGTVFADLSVGPNSITALGQDPELLINEPHDGTDWHIYRYVLDPAGIEWWVDGVSLGTATVDMLIPNVTDLDRRINMFITSASAHVELDYIHVEQSSTALNVALDVKPGSCPNPLNPMSQGKLPAAILGTAELDVTTIDPVSIRLEGVAPIQSSLEDVATPFEPFTGREDCEYDCNKLGPDGWMDLSLKFRTQDIVSVLGELEKGECRVLTLTGNLKEQYGGTSFLGEDVVLILGKRKGVGGGRFDSVIRNGSSCPHASHSSKTILQSKSNSR